MPNRNHNQDNRGDEGRHGKGRGFAGMDAEQQRQIASAGGRAAHASGHAHEFSPEEAREAGRKGGEARSLRSRSQNNDRDIQDRNTERKADRSTRNPDVEDDGLTGGGRRG